MSDIQAACEELAKGCDNFRSTPDMRPDLEWMLPVLLAPSNKTLYTDLWRATHTDFWPWQSRDLSRGQPQYPWLFARS